MQYYDPHLKKYSRKLRQTMTEAEIVVWRHIRKKQINGLQFFRQKPIGHFIVDFYCPKKKLVIEIDGGQHYDNDGLESDEKRDAYLKSFGCKVLRFTNVDVNDNLEGVIEALIYETSGDR